MPEAQAKAIAREYANLMQHQVDQFATKEDIKLLRNDLQHVEERLDTKIDSKFNQLDAKVDKLDTKFDGLMWRMMVNM